MNEFEKPRNKNFEEKRKQRKQVRLRQADFSRLEEGLGELGGFEFEVREKIASQSETPLDHLIREENESEFRKESKEKHLALKSLAKQARLTPRETECLKLILEGASERQMVSLINLSRRSIREIKLAVFKKLKRARHEKTLKKELDRAWPTLTRLQKKVLYLRLSRGLRIPQIAKLLCKDPSGIRKILKRGLECLKKR